VTTSINGKPATWTPEILEAWTKALQGIDDPAPVTSANYFTPRPYRNEYDRGSDEYGFTYIRSQPNGNKEVYQVKWRTPQ